MVLLLFLCACPSFANVKTTAKLGQKLGDQPIIVSDWIAECEAPLLQQPKQAQQSDGKPKKNCRTDREAYENLFAAVRDVSVVLQNYAATLQDAADAKDVTVEKDTAAVFEQLGKLNPPGAKALPSGLQNSLDALAKKYPKLTPSTITTIIDTVVKFASQSYRRSKIAEAVTAAAPHVALLEAIVEAEVDTHLRGLNDLRGSLTNKISTFDTGVSDTLLPTAQMMLLERARLDVRIESLTQLLAACQSFRKAHDKLADRIQHDKPWENGEMLAELKTDVETIVKALQKKPAEDKPAPGAPAAPGTTVTEATH